MPLLFCEREAVASSAVRGGIAVFAVFRNIFHFCGDMY